MLPREGGPECTSSRAGQQGLDAKPGRHVQPRDQVRGFQVLGAGPGLAFSDASATRPLRPADGQTAAATAVLTEGADKQQGPGPTSSALLGCGTAHGRAVPRRGHGEARAAAHRPRGGPRHGRQEGQPGDLLLIVPVVRMQRLPFQAPRTSRTGPGPIVRAGDQAGARPPTGACTTTPSASAGASACTTSNTDPRGAATWSWANGPATTPLLVDFDSERAPGLFQSRGGGALGQLDQPSRGGRRGDSLEGRVRYRDPRVPLHFEPRGEGRARVRFQEPQRRLASGQICWPSMTGRSNSAAPSTPSRARRRRVRPPVR